MICRFPNVVRPIWKSKLFRGHITTPEIGKLYLPKCFNCFTQMKPTIRTMRKVCNDIGSALLIVSAGASGYLLLTKSAVCLRSRVETVSSPSCDNAKLVEYGKPEFDWKLLLSLLKGEALRLILAIVAAVCAATLNILIPIQLGQLSNQLVSLSSSSGQTVESLLAPSARLLGIYAAQALCTCLYINWLSVAGERIAAKLRVMMFRSLVNQDIEFFDRHKTGELISRLSNDVQSFKSSFKQCISHGLRGVTQIGGCVISMFKISPYLTALMTVVLPVLVISGTIFGHLLRILSRQAEYQLEKAVSMADESLGNVRTVRAFAMEDQQTALFEAEANKSEYALWKLGAGISLFQGASNFVLNSLVLTVMYGGGKLLMSDSVTHGDLIAFLTSTQMIQRSMAQISLLFGQVVRGLTSGSRVFEFINEQPNLIYKEDPNFIMDVEAPPSLQFERVTFEYPTRKNQTVISDLSFRVNPGTTVALVGSSGHGKSTIAALAERFYDPVEGEVAINDINIREIPAKWLRGRLIGYISQEPVLFAASIADNIRFGKPDASYEEVIAAAKKANAYDFVQNFPQGFDTVLGERGVTVSGGQKQRIAIARALIKNPKILILDEATSALDSASEATVQKTLDSVSNGLTVLVIAHRLSTIKNADKIIVLGPGGKIQEAGSHSQLMDEKTNPKGIYRQMLKLQSNNQD